ncbi:MAG: acyloxyacyl hydrolase [Paludibacter sp.]|nr:acyloxyacyl hydrolase [Paludibacter sp.]
MTLKLVRIAILSAMLMVTTLVAAQVDNYKAEIGVLGGSAFYLGEANNRLFKNNQFDFGLIYRHKLDPRIAVSAMWNSTKVVGGENATAFDNPVNAIDVVGEFNFFDYEDKVYKPNSRKHTLYIFAGLGGMIFPYTNSGGESLNFMFSYPVGLGYKIMLGKRFNVNLIWSNRLLLNDKMEGLPALNNNVNLNGSNILNNDGLSTFTVGLTFNIWKEKCNCNQN